MLLFLCFRHAELWYTTFLRSRLLSTRDLCNTWDHQNVSKCSSRPTSHLPPPPPLPTEKKKMEVVNWVKQGLNYGNWGYRNPLFLINNQIVLTWYAYLFILEKEILWLWSLKQVQVLCDKSHMSYLCLDQTSKWQDICWLQMRWSIFSLMQFQISKAYSSMPCHSLFDIVICTARGIFTIPLSVHVLLSCYLCN